MGNFGLPGGVFISPLAPVQNEYHRPASAQEMTDFVAKMKNGGVKVLFVHGVNPVFELPKHLGFAEALANVPQVISFATFPDETALASDYIFPDHHGLEVVGVSAGGRSRRSLCFRAPSRLSLLSSIPAPRRMCSLPPLGRKSPAICG